MPEVRLCGTTTVVAASGELTGEALGGAGARRLLGRLALVDGAPVPERQLVADLGPLDRLQADAAVLAVALDLPGVVVVDPAGWRLPPGWAVVDYAVARRLLDRAARTGPSTTLALTLRALRSSGGVLLASEGGSAWAVRAREAHEAALRDALVRAAAAATALHDLELAAGLLARVPGAGPPVAPPAVPVDGSRGGSGGGGSGVQLRSPWTGLRAWWHRPATPVAHG